MQAESRITLSNTDVWREADFDAIPVPSFCNLPKEEVQRIQRNFLGRPVMQHGSSPEDVLQQLRSKGYSSWKEYLLQRTYDRESVELGYQVLTDSDDED
ncbi:hypothetical protein ABBQ38_015062 [Trebouxia sp. C0009 RCD-2024]